jgi:hypothetical protein
VSRLTRIVVAALLVLASSPALLAQRGGGPPVPAPLPRVAAPIDLTGYWVSIVTQDWRWRMLPPARGDYSGIQLTPEARKAADAWDPAKDEAGGEPCRSYGAPALMSVPGRVHITWEDDRTLRVDTDAGTQTRLLRFEGGPTRRNEPRSWQGTSVAEWQMPRPNVPLILRPASPTAGEDLLSDSRGGSLRVVTTNLRAGYLRSNGVPYSQDAVLTEHWDVFMHGNGDEWLTITTELVDPVYLRQPRLVALPFKREPDGSKRDPSSCSARW